MEHVRVVEKQFLRVDFRRSRRSRSASHVLPDVHTADICSRDRTRASVDRMASSLRSPTQHSPSDASSVGNHATSPSRLSLMHRSTTSARPRKLRVRDSLISPCAPMCSGGCARALQHAPSSFTDWPLRSTASPRGSCASTNRVPSWLRKGIPVRLASCSAT